jgi:hypothetical protein
VQKNPLLKTRNLAATFRKVDNKHKKRKKPVASTKQNFEKASARVSPTKALVHPQVQAPKLSFMIVRFRQRG